jgi:hypothetical protein
MKRLNKNKTFEINRTLTKPICRAEFIKTPVQSDASEISLRVTISRRC